MSVFEAGADEDDMEDMDIGLRPYAEQGDIQLLVEGVYQMALRIGLSGYADRFGIQFMDATSLPEGFHQGSWCDLEQNLDLEPDQQAQSDDVNVYVGPDSNNDGAADSYIITTGDIAWNGPGSTPVITAKARTATICSDAGHWPCAGPGGSDMCNLLGKVQVQFTIYATNQ